MQMAQHRCEGGEHGYDNTFESMQAVFLAYGPAFKEKTKVEPFELIEVYNMMAEILDIEKPAPNNGTKGSLSHLLANPKDVPTSLEPAKSHYESCKFPNYAEWLLRSNRSDCRCDNFTNISSGKSVWQVDLQLNLTQDQVEHATQRHLPLGIPVLTMENAAVGTLTQTDFIVGFDKKFHTPRWTAFRLDGQKGKPVLNDSRVNTAIPACVRTDVRLSSESDANCSSYEEPAQNITTGYLFHPGFSNDSLRRMDSLISSNIVPMYRNFLTGIWKDAMLLVEEFAEKYGEIHVMTGPVYDYDANGHRDNKAQIKRFVSNGPVPLPTHYYVAAARCETGGDVGKCDHDSVLALAIVIPHRPAILNSKKPIDYLKDNVVRIKDLELLTGLQLFPNITGSNRIILKTFLAVGLWPRFSWMDEEKCIGPEEPVCPWSDSAPLLLISLDGYRDSYLERNLNPVIQKLFKCGSKAPYMRSIYPTLTFPNHYSIVTGLYPESHGIVDNSMYDMNISLPFYLGSPFMNDTRWWLGEPLWNTVTKHKKTAMTFFWPGSDVIIHGKRPNKWVQFNGNYPYAGRVDAILNWINGGTGKRPDFLTLYMELVDKAGHSGGENSLQVNESLVEVDLLMGQLMDGLYRVGLHNCINIIVTADHGMADIAPERNEFLKDYLSNATLSNTYSFLGPAGRISNLYKRSKPPKKGNTHIPPELQTKIADIMNNLTCKTQHMAEYEKPNFAKRHHYAATDRIDSILLYLQEEWQVSRSQWGRLMGASDLFYTLEIRNWMPAGDNPILHFLKGNHGWDPNLESMWALFIAHGPDIKPQHTIKPFENIELYNLMADLLNITAAPNNGTRGSLYHIMRKPPSLAIPSGNPYDSCDFPNDKAEYERRANRTCDCENSTLPDPADVRKWDHRLNLTNDIQHQLANKHMPHGTLLSSYNGSLCLLYHQDFVSAYASALKLPLWTASTVTKSMVSSATGVSSLGPVRPDVRLEQSDQINNCYYLSIKDQNISQASLFTPAFSTNKTTVTDTWIWTNGVPMLSGFLDGIWQYLLKRVKGWVTRYGDLHIVAGPVYDYNYDGVADTTEDIQKNKDEHLNMSLPTHYYMVLLRCPSTNPMKCRDMDYDVQSFILPHLPNVTNCMTEDAYLLEHVARIRDIELLTSTQFLAANNTQTAILTRTYIPHELWLP